MQQPLRLCLAFSAALALTAPARAESLSDRRAAKEATQAVEVEVACGKLEKENCAIVVPEINAKTVPVGLRLKPLESKGSVESVNSLCDGDVQIAVVQADVLVQRVTKPDCTGKVVVLGSPLYPYEGFMVVRAETREDKFGDMVANPKSGAVLHVAAGGSGSGGRGRAPVHRRARRREAELARGLRAALKGATSAPPQPPASRERERALRSLARACVKRRICSLSREAGGWGAGEPLFFRRLQSNDIDVESCGASFARLREKVAFA